MEGIFEQNGYLKNILNEYEFRSEQLQLAEFILERLYEAENGIIEAGTGIGKTLAYLIPSIIYAVENEKKISLTTETKALQKQLIDKDIPLVKKILKEYMDIDFSCSLCLGSSNYPCRKRFELIVSKGKLLKKELKYAETIKELFKAKKPFTRFDVKVSNHFWSEISREGDACSSFRCPFAGICSYQLARKEWSDSTVLVMNHYLFFTNIASDKIYLPQTDIVIFDEAHSIEDIASSQLGFNNGYNELVEILSHFYQPKSRNVLLNNIEKVSLRRNSIELIKKITSEASVFFEKTRDLVDKGKMYFRIRKPVGIGTSFIEKLKEFMLLMTEVEEDFGDDEALRIEFDIARGKLFLYLENLKSFVYHTDDNFVYWIEKDRNEIFGDISLRGQPITISEIMGREVVSYYESVLFVSATLSLNGDFAFITGRLGISRHKSITLKSTFNFKNQMILYVGRDMVEPNNSNFINQSSRCSADIINRLNGNCLMLFTSYKMLGDIKETLLNEIDFQIYSQDELSSSEAVENYINDNNSVLMGTHSFWQGIDLPGDLVRGVIMMRLPFSVPDTPQMEAKIERLKEQGKNPFSMLQMPEAVIKFKQGFGRLIRSHNDKGIVAVLDSRIFQKSYGKIFLRSLPECQVVYSVDELKKKYTELTVDAT